MKKNLIVIAMALSGLLLGSCAKPPQVELDAVKASINKTKMAEADVYMPVEFAALQDSLNVIQAEIEVQKSKMFGKYEAVKQKITVLETLAMDLEGNTMKAKELLTQEVKDLHAQLTQLVIDNNALVAKAPKGKEGKAAIEAIKGELAIIEAAVNEIPGMLASGKILESKTKAQAAFEKATALHTELTAVVDKYNKRKK